DVFLQIFSLQKGLNARDNGRNVGKSRIPRAKFLYTEWTWKIPSTYVAEDHQVKNATFMSEAAGVKLLYEDELDSTTLANSINDILGKGLFDLVKISGSKLDFL
ncbi:hypothetical protein KI387_026912, partial [Taxus chinensis]